MKVPLALVLVPNRLHSHDPLLIPKVREVLVAASFFFFLIVSFVSFYQSTRVRWLIVLVILSQHFPIV